MVDFYTTGLSNKNGKLYAGGVAVDVLASKFGTPLYVMNFDRAIDNFKRIQNAFTNRYSNSRVKFAMKSNPNADLLMALREVGAQVDTISLGELSLAFRVGFKPEEILYNGPGQSREDMKIIAQSGVIVNFDSKGDYEKYLSYRMPSVIAVRVNPGGGFGHHKYVITAGEDSKFGIWPKEALEIYKQMAAKGVKKFGIHMHVGSNSFNVQEFLTPLTNLMDLVGQIAKETQMQLEYVDIGGGFGVPYKPEQNELDINTFAAEICKTFKNKLAEYKLGSPILYLEPGRYISADSTILLAKVTNVKKTPYKEFAFIDAGMNCLIRPALYGAYHHVLVNGKLNEKENKTYDVVGQICESGDFLAKDRKLPEIKEDDLIAILTAGAYGMCMASNFNLKDKPKEIIIRKGKATPSN